VAIKYWGGCWNGRAPAGDVHRRARNIISPSGGIMRGKFPSKKNGRMIHHEGLLECDAIYLFELSPLITRYREQPVKINYPDGDRLRLYTPDFELVLATNEIVLIEVKPTRSLQRPEIRHKLDCIAAHFERIETTFNILTETTIRQEPRLSNLRWLYRQLPRVIPTHDAMKSALSQRSSLFPLSLKKSKSAFEGTGVDIYSLLLSGLVQCSHEVSISIDTQIHLVEEVDNGWFQIMPGSGY